MKHAAALAFLLAFQDAPPRPDPFGVKVSDAVRARIAALVAQSSGSKVKLEEAVEQAGKFDAAIVDEVAKKLAVSPDEVRDAWKKREKKARKPTYGDGSWIVLGGQDGGLDSDKKGTPVAGKDFVDSLIDRSPTILTRRKPQAPPEPVALGKAIKTKAEWWATATPAERAGFVEAEFARKSVLVDKKEETKKCATCNEKGTLNTNRGGIGLVVLCGRCHGAKLDLIVVYE
jgi:hypothetical protein